MENASKALIIAGAILLSILIISLGIIVVNNTRSTIDKANVNQQEVATFNSQFEAYVGSGKTASDVRSLISVVNSNNGAQRTNGTNHYVVKDNKATTTAAPASGAATPMITMETGLSAGSTYTITAYYDNSGYVCAVYWDDGSRPPQV